MSFASLTAGPLTAPTWTQVRYLATGTLIALALLLLARHLAEALVVPLSPTMSLACGFALGALVLVGEWEPTRGLGGGTHLPRIAAALAAILLPTASTAALLSKFVWVVPVAVASYRRSPGAAIIPGKRPAAVARVRQQLTRTSEADGRDVCRGSARAEFVAGQRSASIHLAFCPPFAVTPQLETAAAETFDATVKVAQVLPYAARIDVKLSEPAAAPRDLIIAFTASAPQ